MSTLRIPRMWQPLRISSLTEFYLVFVAVGIPWQSHQILRKGVTAFHVVNAILVCGILVSLLINGPKPKWHLAIPMYVYMLGSVLGMFNSEVYSINIYTLSQDIYLYVWFIVLCVFLNAEHRVELLIVAWALTLILVLGTDGFLPSGHGSQRGEYSFRNPNRAAAYLSFTLFLLLHPVIPLPFKAIACVLVFIGVRATGSAAGSIGVVLAAASFGWSVLYMRSRRSARPLLILGVVSLGLLIVVINPLQNNSLPTLLGSVAPSAAPRIERSADSREEIWTKGMESFEKHPFGIGPASFHKQIDSGVSDDGSIELHSDPVASLVERGVVGFLGYILLILATIREVFRMMHRSEEWRDIVWAAALTGACTVYFFYSITHEALHHETFWLMIALVFSQVRILDEKRKDRILVPIRDRGVRAAIVK